MKTGHFGRYLDVSLTKRSINDYQIPDEWYQKFLGGRGIGARIMLEELEPGIDPLGPDNIIVFATGPLQGLSIPGGGRHLLMAKSPKTNGISGSYVGGFLGQQLGKSGYDGIIIRGASPEPKYLVLKDGKANIKDATELWGCDTATTENKIRKKEGDVRVASIGLAGENLVKFSCVIHDKNRAAGRPGFGAVMGSKKLKAVAVSGNRSKKVHEPNLLSNTRKEFTKTLYTTKSDSLGKYGTSGGVMALNERGILPTKNFKLGEFEDAEKISGQTIYDKILKHRDTCNSCPIRCKRTVSTKFNGEEVRPEYGGPEYETVAAFGSLCMNSDLNAIALANQKCNQHGLDTISTGVTIAFLIEASEKNLLDYEIEWGDSKKIVDLVDRIANRQGVGDRLAEGIDKLEQELNSNFAMQIKGQEVPMHEPRGKKGLGISYATTPRGANHMEGIHDTQLEQEPLAPELGVSESIDRFRFEGKARVMKIFEDLRSFTNSLILCAFTTDMVGNNYSFETVRKFIKAVTGNELDSEGMLTIGERNYLLLKLLSSQEGHTSSRDRLPKRFYQSLKNGAAEGESIPQEKLQQMLDKYYEYRGYDQYGPTDRKLRDLNLAEFTNRLNR